MLPLLLMHILPLGALFVQVKLRDWLVLAALYYVRMFGITAGYHRYFAHKSYRLGRVMQFLMALLGTTAAQKGVLWWAGHHRHHHRFSDQPDDLHSPKQGFWWSHIGWILADKHKATNWEFLPRPRAAQLPVRDGLDLCPSPWNGGPPV